jgi:C_GCAxxG_C_C family probable redox protein
MAMTDPTDVAVQRFRDGFNCSQAVFAAFAEREGLAVDVALRIAGTFGGGIARTGQTCGAVTGALMALGLRYGTTTAGDANAKERQYGPARDLMTRFADRHHSTRCCDLLGCDIGTPEGRQLAVERGLLTNLCPELVADAARLVADWMSAEAGGA